MNYGYGWRKKKYEKKRVTPKSSRSYQLYQRVSAQVQQESGGPVISGRVFLHDLSMVGIGIFLREPLPVKTQIYLVIEHPKHLFIKGEIIGCRLYTLNARVLSTESYLYRAGIRFIFDTSTEREVVERYCQSLSEK